MQGPRVKNTRLAHTRLYGPPKAGVQVSLYRAGWKYKCLVAGTARHVGAALIERCPE